MINYEEELERYLCNRYGIIKLTSGIKKRLEEAYNSSLHVKPERLLNCWRTMEQALNNTRMQNVARGNTMSGVALLGYDLTIVLGKYESYMRYIIAAEKQMESVKDTMEMHEIMKSALKNKPKPKPKHELRDVSEWVEEIFFSEGR